MPTDPKENERPPAQGETAEGSDVEDVERGKEADRASRSEEVERAQAREAEAQEG